MDTERSLSAAMKAEIHAWMYDEDSEQQLADRLAGLAEQHFAGSVPAQTNPGAEHYERVMLTCAALEGAMVNVEEIEHARLSAEYAEEAADYALERIAWREAESADEAESTDAPTAKLSYEPHVCRAEGCDDPPRYCGAHAGVDTTVSDATDAATVIDEVYRLQSRLRQVEQMAGYVSLKLHRDDLRVLNRAVQGLRTTIYDLSRHFGVQGKGGDLDE